MKSKIEQDLMCEVNAISYNPSLREGYIDVPPGDCVSMPSAVRLFEQIDPAVKIIYAGDVEYRRGDDGWAASFFRGGLHIRITTKLVKGEQS